MEKAQTAAQQAGGARARRSPYGAGRPWLRRQRADARTEAAAIAAESGQLADRKAAVEAEQAAVRTRLAQTEQEAKTNRRARRTPRRKPPPWVI